MCRDLVPVEDDDEAERGNKAAGQNLQPNKQPAVRNHLHEEVLLMGVYLRHTVILEKR